MASSYKTSINLGFDYQDNHVLNGYIPSKTHEAAIVSFLDGLSKKNSQRAHIIYGPYGTGKSYLTNVFLNMVINQENFEKSKAFKKINSDKDFESVQDTYNLFKLTNKTYLPIFFNGFEGDINSLILEKLTPIIADQKLNVKNEFLEVYYEVLDNWKSQFPKTYKNFLDELSERKVQLGELELNIKKNNKASIDLFHDIYSNLTSGAKLRSYSSKNSLIILEKVLVQLKKVNKGIVLIYDEFGRFLQNISENNLISTLQDLQDIAELANNGAENFSFILIAHKPINSYFLRFPSDFKPEFERIEKRFKASPITTNEKITYKLARYLIEEFPGEITKLKDSKVNQLLDSINKTNFFKDFSQKEINDDLIIGIQPFNPFTICYLNYLSSVYGQNERSMMSFLFHASQERFKPSEISIYSVNSYFFPSIELFPEDNYFLKILKKKLLNSKVLIENKELRNLFVLIAFWYALGLNKIQEVTPESFAIILDMNEVTLEVHLSTLENAKLVRKNLTSQSYEPFETSGINIEKLIQDNLSSIVFENSKFQDNLIDIIGFSSIRSSFYNYKYKMTRFASLNFKFGLTTDKENEIDDYSINVYLIDQTTAKTKVKEIIDHYSKNKFIGVIIHKVPLPLLMTRLEKLNAALYIKFNRSEFNNYSNFIEDLDYFIAEQKLIIREMIKSIEGFNFEENYFYLGDPIKISDKYEMIKHISEIMESLYPNTIVINNDQINKSNITSVQKNAIESLGNKLLKFIHVNDGTNGPDVLAYLTIFIENEFDPFIFETEKFGNFKKLKDSIYSLLNQERRITEITNIFTERKSKYFIRKPLVPIILLGILRPIWENLMFFGNKTFIKDIDYKFFQDMIFDDHTNYTVSRIIYSEKQLKSMNKIIDVFSKFEENKYLPRHIRAYKSSTGWLRGLGQFVIQTHQLTKEAQLLRDLILQSEFVPLEAFEKIGELLGEFDHEIEEINNFIHNKSKIVLDIILKAFKVKKFSELKNRTIEFKKEVHVGNKLASTILLANSEAELVNNLSKSILELEFKDISDSIFDLLLNQINILSKLALTGEFNQDELNVVSVNNQIIALPKVSSSVTGNNLKERIIGMVGASKLRVSKEEVLQILFEILKEKTGGK